jgi:hypothetical protein
MPLMAFQTEWYSFPIRHGFLGTNIEPGHFHQDVYFDIDSSGHDTHDGVNVSVMLSSHAVIRSRTS